MKTSIVPWAWLWMGILIFTGHGIQAQENRVSARIGIEIRSGQKMSLARSREMIHPGDRIRIYVHTRQGLHVYVVYKAEKMAELLNVTTQKVGESTLCLPSAHAYYKVDGNSPVERFTILCSPEELPRISGMAGRGIPWGTWLAIEKGLVRESRIALNQSPQPVIEIAGNVRGGDEAGASFIDVLPTYSGKGLLVKIYEFRIQ